MFDNITIFIMMGIMIFSKSYQQEVFWSLLIFVPIFLIKVFFTLHKYKKMGTTLIKLHETTCYSWKSHFVMLVIIFSILALTDLVSHKHRIWIPVLILISLQTLCKRFLANFMRNCLMEKGICIHTRLVDWNRVRSNRWVIPSKKKNPIGISLDIRYSEFIFKQFAYINISYEQKDEVDELLNKMVGI